MFAMKKIILAAALIAVFSGFAAAQSTSAKTATKSEKATVKKSPTVKISDSKSTVLKQEASANAKGDSAMRLILPSYVAVDTTAALPKVKNDF